MKTRRRAAYEKEFPIYYGPTDEWQSRCVDLNFTLLDAGICDYLDCQPIHDLDERREDKIVKYFLNWDFYTEIQIKHSLDYLVLNKILVREWQD